MADKNIKKPKEKSKLFLSLSSWIKKALWTLGKDAFLFILIFTVLDIIAGEYLFYKYVLLSEILGPDREAELMATKFNKTSYESVLKEWQERQNTLDNSSKITYPDPFK